MCYICNCFAWTLDLLQRLLTFVLSCWLAVSVCCGLSIAAIAGIAYGYNYCLAEFITLTRSDVRVYMRRGQFHDRPDLLHAKRKFGDEDDLFPFNLSDYQQQVPVGDDSLSDKWMKDQDTRKYVEKLDKYAEEKTFVDASQQVDIPENTIYYKFRTPPFRKASYVPNRILSTTILQSGTSQIILRHFETMPDIITDIIINDSETNDYRVKDLKDVLTTEDTLVDEIDMKVKGLPPDIRIRVEDNPKGRTIKMRHWRTTSQPIIADYSPGGDEDAVVYRAI